MATQKRTTTGRTGAAKRPRKRTAVKRRSEAGKLANFFIPLFFIVGILFCLGFLSLTGYRTATASAFFDVKTIDVRGISRASKDDIERIVRLQTNKSGAWNADLNEIKIDIEKLMFVKSAVVSRVLPDGLRVSVNERVPRVVVRTKTGDFWTDDESVVLDFVKENETRPPFVLRGWDESKTDKAARDNQERVKIYLKMLDEWRDFDLAKRVETVDITSLQRPQAVVQDSGQEVAIILSKGDFGKKLKTGIENVVGRGNELSAIDVSENKPFLTFRK
ncbi:MAG: FtsQ-type POTRA domain-containing protein [Pyrinomonadaceae bacterium]|nr:FtsQ-type POTRA domain-containing protein [Pyrinomonadaceae bacterium]